ncbi:MAG TPA: excinuclease ABC subunit UvrC [Patescibacteria group bacterium]|nr:excinuclease ABC subunit UvrC [Patescibacteria group bacterium]
MNEILAKKLKDLPQKPGVYIFKDAKGLFLYVGKGIKLKNRVSSYFRKDAREGSPRIQYMISQIKDLDYVVTDNEVESLVLENNFIKQIKPKYNVRLRDDKNYLFLKINIKDEIPTIEYDRKPSDKNARYFGPYTAAISVRDTLRLLRRIFPYCANKKVGSKPCFYYHIGKCPGVCIGKISLSEYRSNYIKKIIQFLEGRQTEILTQLKMQMNGYARSRMFERAARVRDQIFALNRVLERQKLVYPKKIDQDIFSLHQNGVASVNLFMIREGKLIQKENFILENTKQALPQEILESFLGRYYLDCATIPKEILLPVKINELEIKKLLQEKTKRQVKILVPVRGPKLKLLNLGEENAKQYLESQSDKQLLEEARLLSSLRELQRVLELKNLPGRIEAYDISNVQGTSPVGSMIVFDFARPKKENYRKFKINRKQTPDDFAMMAEMLQRRFKHAFDEERIKRWPMPDLILIDGGKGQLNVAVKVLKLYKLNIPIIGLAKRLEEIFSPGKNLPLTLPKNSQALFLLQKIRDEAHRFAVSYHRLLRSKKSVSSKLDDIPGIGSAKKRLLLQKFGSLAKINSASLGEVANLVGRRLAEKIKASL